MLAQYLFQSVPQRPKLYGKNVLANTYLLEYFISA